MGRIGSRHFFLPQAKKLCGPENVRRMSGIPVFFTWQPLGKIMLKVKLLVGYISKIPLNSKGAKGNKAII